MKINTSTGSARGNTFKLMISLIIPQLAGGLGSYFTIGSVKDWYPVLVKPSLNPPSWVFGPVWTALFALMGIAAFLVWRKGLNRKDVKIALGIFISQLILNVLWSIIFFGSTSLTINGLNNIGIAFIELIVLWLAILATIVAFSRVSRPAAWLLVPYILWVSFAGYLNFSIWSLNRDRAVRTQVDQREAVDMAKSSLAPFFPTVTFAEMRPSA